MAAVRTVADLARAPGVGDEALVVVCLCAAWCDTCRAFRPTYEALAAADAAGLYVWLDVEDDAELLGDVDVETFPTLAIYRGDRLLHYGVSLPHAANVARVIAAAAGRGDAFAGAPEAVVAIARTLLARA
jgi:thioredoxin reductase (NADPH)